MGDDRASVTERRRPDSAGDPIIGAAIAVDTGYNWHKRWTPGSTPRHAVLKFDGRWYAACSIAAPGRASQWVVTTRESKRWFRFVDCTACTIPVYEEAKAVIAARVEEVVVP